MKTYETYESNISEYLPDYELSQEAKDLLAKVFEVTKKPTMLEVTDKIATSGATTFDDDERRFKIYIKRESIDEITITHEILHCKLRTEGFPDGSGSDTIATLVAGRLNSAIEDVVVLERQKLMGLPLRSLYEKWLRDSIKVIERKAVAVEEPVARRWVLPIQIATVYTGIEASYELKQHLLLTAERQYPDYYPVAIELIEVLGDETKIGSPEKHKKTFWFCLKKILKFPHCNRIKYEPISFT